MIAQQDYGVLLRSFGLAISVHVLMVLLIVLGTMSWKPFRQPQPVGMTIEAVIVDSSAIRERREEAARAVAEAEQRKQAQERRAQELQQQRQREQETEIQRQQDLAVQKQREREEAQRKKEAQDKLAALRVERERKQEEERNKQQKELEQVRQQAQAAEKKRQQEAERLKQIEARKQAEAAAQRRKSEEAERQKQVAAAAAQDGRKADLREEYTAVIQALVTQNWLRPPTAQAGLRCTVRIRQIPGGEVISAEIIGPFNGDDATRRSIIDAVERASPLPYAEYRDAFEPEIDFIFIYDGE